MKITYDPKVDAMYIRFKKGNYDYTKKITDNILMDFSDKKEVLGLEILDASHNIGSLRPDKLIVELSRFKTQRQPTIL